MMFVTWKISSFLLEQTASAFTSGTHEVFVIWTASRQQAGAFCTIRRCVVPQQTPGFSAGGVYVHIEGDELNRIQFDNYDHGERSVVQLHTHPSADVRMSRLDRSWEVVSHVGALSIIVPYYGRVGLRGFPGVHVYERDPDDWRLWTRAEIEQRLRVIDG